jgi:hypothetical protein
MGRFGAPRGRGIRRVHHLTQAEVGTTLPWNGIRHVTKTKDTWIFAPGSNSSSILLPAHAMTDAQTEQLTALFSAWPARKYRRAAL